MVPVAADTQVAGIKGGEIMIYSKRFFFVNNIDVPKIEGTCTLSGRNTPASNTWKITMFLQGITWADTLTTDGFEVSATFDDVTVYAVSRVSDTKIDLTLNCPEWKEGTVTVRPLDSNLGENMTCPVAATLDTTISNSGSGGGGNPGYEGWD